jgi:hypothetical protein
MADNQDRSQATAAGDGPGDSYVPTTWIIAIAAYLVVVTVVCFVGLVMAWPARLAVGPATATTTTTAASQNPNANSNANASGTNRNANTNSNANASAGANANTNAAANANVGGTESPGAPPSGNANVRSNQSASQGSPQPSVLRVTSVSPCEGPANGSTQVEIGGTGFADGATVTFGSTPATDIKVVSSVSITAAAPKLPAGRVDVTVTNKDNAKDTRPNGFEFIEPVETTMIILVIFAGAIGGALHSLRSVSWYVGQRDFKWSWYLMYVLLPFVGASIALAFYLVLRAGFVDLPTNKGGIFATVGLAALIGLFSQQAALKLKKVAEAILTTPQPGANSRPQGTVTGPVSPPPPSGGGGPITLSRSQGAVNNRDPVTITGTGFTPAGVTVSFGQKPATVIPPVTATSIQVTPPTGDSPGKVQVVVTNIDGKKSGPADYTYTE